MARVIYEEDINEKTFEYAKEVILNGGLVAFPTETVYGLGASALDNIASVRIFEAKGRPSDNPLIVHIWNIEQVKDIAINVPDIFYKLAEKFWPGPLTMIVKKGDNIPLSVTGRLNTVGIRMPNHPVALKFLEKCNIPIAAPSANLSGKPSPTNVDHVIRDLGTTIDMIIDGGPCEYGLESTVLDLTSVVPVILRPGGVTYEQLREVIPTVQVDPNIYEMFNMVKNPKSPGMKYRHYSPKAQVIMFEGDSLDEIVNKIKEKEKELKDQGHRVGILATNQTQGRYDQSTSMGDREEPITISRNLFKFFRAFDDIGAEYILMEGIDKNNLGMAIVNRMIRASAK